ncbi:cell death abnormality protein 1-like [Saccostrea echinata]|uniref:cell death abnormality protein 1-like n=1 Tax=Saccostrea echinata TaxID=191078 RepID=UPI002A833E7F|nr:cell death abnormality protein 1-like [Saccostrea echinata]
MTRNCCLPGFYWNKDSKVCTECKRGFFGHDCSNPCRYPNYGKRCQKECNCTEDFCDIAVGCRSCKVGYYGKTCSNQCRFPSYGERCQFLCNCSETACNHINGCQSGTEPGLLKPPEIESDAYEG